MRESNIFDVGKGHPEIITAIFDGDFGVTPIGGLDRKTAAEILKILHAIHIRTNTDPVRAEFDAHPYDPGESVADIYTKAHRLRPPGSPGSRQRARPPYTQRAGPPL